MRKGTLSGRYKNASEKTGKKIFFWMRMNNKYCILCHKEAKEYYI